MIYRFPAKPRCKWRSTTREWNRLEERYGYCCRNQAQPCYPGLCIEDWRSKTIFCPNHSWSEDKQKFLGTITKQSLDIEE